MPVYVHEVPIYGGDLVVCRGKDPLRAAQRHGFCPGVEPEPLAEAWAHEHSEGLSWVVGIRPGASPGVMAHEAVHVANWILKARGIDPDLDNDEPYAYLVQWIVDALSGRV